MENDLAGNGGPQAQRIDVNRAQDLREWSRKLDTTEDQLRDAIQAVGPLASDVEDHLKGSRATTNSERTRQALKDTKASDT
jgi:ABC-type transporter Mla subunit MlaD